MSNSTPTTQRDADERMATSNVQFLAHWDSVCDGYGFGTEFNTAFKAAEAAWDAACRFREQGGITNTESASDIAATDQPSAGHVDERTLFESYMVDRHGPCVDLTRTGEAEKGEYRNESVDNVREGWIAGRASLTPTSPNLSEADMKWILSCRGMRNVAERAYQLGLSRATPTAPDWRDAALAAAWPYIKDVESVAKLFDTPTAPQAASQQAEVPEHYRKVLAMPNGPDVVGSPLKVCRVCGSDIGALHALNCTHGTSTVVEKDCRAPQAATTASAPVQAAQPAPKLLGQVVMYPNYSTVIQWVEGVTPPAGTKLYEIPDAAPGAAQTTDARDAARYRVLRQNVAPRDVSIIMDVPPQDIPADQSLAERIDMLCDRFIKRATDKGQTNE